jgi:anti-sigma B factor antagonist
MSKTVCNMRLEAFDTSTMTVHVSCEGTRNWDILNKLSTLIAVSTDCGFDRIVFEPPQRLPMPTGVALAQLAERNGVMLGAGDASTESARDEFGFIVLARDPRFLCLRDSRHDTRYLIYLAACEENVDLGARIAYLLASVLGFTSLISFEIRFSVYELLSNTFEHGLEKESQQWVELIIEKNGEKLSVSLVDKGVAFDPTVVEQFDLERYMRSGKKRGLGLIMTRKIAGAIQYRRESGFNRTSFEKSNSIPVGNGREAKEETVAQFIVGDPEKTQDGSYLITLEGDLDTKGALVMEDLIYQLLERKMFRVIFDFEKVPFVSSAGVGILLGIVSSLREESGEATFLNVSPKVRSVLRLLNLDDYFKIVDSRESVEF